MNFIESFLFYSIHYRHLLDYIVISSVAHVSETFEFTRQITQSLKVKVVLDFQENFALHGIFLQQDQLRYNIIFK